MAVSNEAVHENDPVPTLDDVLLDAYCYSTPNVTALEDALEMDLPSRSQQQAALWKGARGQRLPQHEHSDMTLHIPDRSSTGLIAITSTALACVTGLLFLLTPSLPLTRAPQIPIEQMTGVSQIPPPSLPIPPPLSTSIRQKAPPFSPPPSNPPLPLQPALCALRRSGMKNLRSYSPPIWCQSMDQDSAACELAYVGFEADGTTRCTAETCVVMQRCAYQDEKCRLTKEFISCALAPPFPPLLPEPPIPPALPCSTAVVRGLNTRFAIGRPSNDLAAAGVFLRGADDAVDTYSDTPWAGRESIKEWFRVNAGDRISGSIMNRRVPFYYRGSGALLAVRPEVVARAFMCAFHTDASSYNSKCDPPGASATCLPGCYGVTKATLDKEGWCNSPAPMDVFVRGAGSVCPYPLADVRGMLQRQEEHTAARGCRCCSWPDCPLYNEVILDSEVWTENLPSTIEAVLFPAGDNAAQAMARRWRHLLLEHFHLDASEVPLVRIGDPEREDAPFSLVE